MEVGYHVMLVNPSKVRQYEGLKHTDDRHDAFWLAHQMRLGILPTGYIYPKEQRAVRDLLRERRRLGPRRLCYAQDHSARQPDGSVPPEAALSGQHIRRALTCEIGYSREAAY
jgi:hypothetical protein